MGVEMGEVPVQNAISVIVTRYYGGRERGVCVQVTLNAELTQDHEFRHGQYFQMTKKEWKKLRKLINDSFDIRK